MNIKQGRLIRFFQNDVVLFIIVFLALSLTYGYQRSSFYPPQGLHQWRQCVGASFAQNYYNYDLDIKDSRVFNYISSGATSDLTIAECPVLYYFIAILYKIFGDHDFIFRIVNALILFLGLFYLFRASGLMLGDKFWAMIIAVALFTSPTLIYYGNSFLPDTSSFGLVLIALFLIVKYSQKPKLRYLYLASMVYALAALLKISALLSLIGLIGTFVLFQIFSRDFRARFRFARFILPMVIPFAVAGGWYYFVYYYNNHFGGTISPVAIRPIWMLDDETLLQTWARIRKEWVHVYFHVAMEIFTAAVLLTTLIFFRRSNRFITVLSLLLLVGGTAFFFLFFKSLIVHDYYLINVFVIVPVILVNGAWMLKRYRPALFRNIYLKLFMAVAMGFLAISAVKIVEYNQTSYTYNHMHMKWFSGFVGLEDVNRQLGIGPRDLVISIPDPSIDISLYLMNQPGFTEYGFNNLKGKERMDYFISKGAKYLFVADSTIYSDSTYNYLKPYLHDRLARQKNVDIFDLRGE